MLKSHQQPSLLLLIQGLLTHDPGNRTHMTNMYRFEGDKFEDDKIGKRITLPIVNVNGAPLSAVLSKTSRCSGPFRIPSYEIVTRSPFWGEYNGYL